MSAHAAVVVPLWAEPSEVVFEVGEGHAFVPDGEYVAVCVGCDVKFVFKALKVFMRFRIAEGPHSGTVVWRAYGVGGRIIPGKGPGSGPRPKLKRRSKLFRMMCRVLNLPRNTNPHRVGFRELAGKLCRITTRTVIQDYEQNALSEAERYSVVEDVLSIEAG